MLALTKRTLKINTRKLISYLLIDIFLGWIFVAFYPSIRDSAEEMKPMIDNYPPEMIEGLGLRMEEMFNSFEGFLAAEHFSIMWPILIIVFVVSYASSTIAGEIESGTIENVLAQPLSRTHIFLSKYFSGTILLFLLTTLGNLIIIPIAFIYDIETNFKSFIFITIIGFLFALAIYSITFMFSSIYSTKGRPTSIVMLMLIVMYAINIIASLEKSIEVLHYSSFFYYFDFNTALIDSHITFSSIVVFIVVSIISTIAGLVYFNRRDITA